MKKNINILFLLLSTILVSQEKTKILESYIIENNDLKDVSKRKLLKNDLTDALRIYLEDDYRIFDDDEKIFDLVTANFDFHNININDNKYHEFSFKTSNRKFRKSRFSEPILSKNGNYAIFYEEEKCLRGLCGGGSLVLMEKINNNWIKKSILFAWIG